jgi:hypothetical protein
MELRNTINSTSRWYPAMFIHESSTFVFPEEERLQLRMKFLYPEYLCSLSAFVDAAAPSVMASRVTLASDSTVLSTGSAFDAAEALLSQLSTVQVISILTVFVQGLML